MTISPGPAIISSSLNLRLQDFVFPVSLLFRVPSAPTISPTCCGSSAAGPSDPGAISWAAVSGLSTATSHSSRLRACQSETIMDAFPGTGSQLTQDHVLAGQGRRDPFVDEPKSD